MNAQPHNSRQAKTAFTLVEMLVVIAVIGVLAALLLPLAGAVKSRAARTKARAELAQVVMGIEAYKDAYGHYPPDVLRGSQTWPRINQLYFELIGTRLVDNNTAYETLDGASRIANTDAAFSAAFGDAAGKPAVRGFVNCTRAANTDDAPPARTFLSQLKPSQYGETAPGSGIRLLACSIRWPETHSFQPVAGNPGLNPWRYVASNPTNNPGAFDLWVDIILAGRTNRISNWSQQPQIVNNSL